MAKISVILPVYNGESYINEAIDSVLKQSFVDFELLVINDGSTDRTSEIINAYSDSRLKVASRHHDFIESLNDGLSRSKSKYIARMDADDVMHPDRLKVQYHIMEEEPSITICTSWMNAFGEGQTSRLIQSDLSGLIQHPEILLLERNIIAHPTVMIRRSFLLDHQLYYKKGYAHAEDYKLWTDCAQYGAVFYIEPEPLLGYRVSSNQVSRIYRDEQNDSANKVRYEHLQHLILNAPHLEAFRGIYVEVDKLYNQKYLTVSDVVQVLCPLIYKAQALQMNCHLLGSNM